MEKDTFIDQFLWRVRNEPVRVAESFRRLVFTVPIILGVSVDDARLTALVTFISLILSWFANEKARDAVTPVVKVEQDLQYDVEFEEMIENYG